MEDLTCIVKTKKQHISDSHSLLLSSFNNAPNYQVLLNKNLEVTLFNEVASTFTIDFFNLQLVEGRKIIDYISPSFVEEFKALCLQALCGETVDYEYFVRRNNAEGAWYIFILNPVSNSNKQIIGLSLVGSSISNRKKQEKTIEHQSKTLSFIAQLQSHQVRQPVSSILGLMNLIKEENYEPKKEYLICLEQATKQLDNIIQLIVKKSRNDC